LTHPDGRTDGGKTRLRVLVIEDEPNDALLLVGELERLGYDVAWERVQTGDEMRASLDKPWDLIVSDYSLPQFDALAALQVARERKLDLPFIIVSGTISEEEAVESMRQGADDFITKGRLARLGPAIVRGQREHAERHALREAEERLRQAQKIEAVGQLAGGVAHDFNNLLGVIQGSGEMVLRSLPPAVPQRKHTEEILKAAARGAALTRQLLTFSRRQPMEPRVLELSHAVGNVEAMLRRLIAEDVEIVVGSDGLGGRVKADPTHIEQVVMNLAINARDAMPQGGRLVIHTSNVDLDADYGRSHPDAVPGPHVRLTVSDTGTGMSPETLGHVFEPFFTTKEVGKGTGLGLATVHGIVRQSGGHLTFHSELGRGTTVHVLLPRVEESATYPAAAPPDAPATAGSETILLIEDEASLREVIADELAYGGYTVLSGATAEEALAAAARHQGPIHLLITDLVMPGIDGREAAIRVRTARPDVRVMYMSGYHPTNVGLEPVDAREAFLQKPFGLDALLRKVREVLDGPASRE
jgi:two-component system, cell cycle sensor histidine kinase and response regulator CckA